MKLFFFKYRQILGTLFGLAFFLLPMLAVHGATNSIPTSDPFSNSIPTATSQPAPVVAGGSHVLQNPLHYQTVCGLVKGLLDAVMIIGIPIAVLFIVWAGFKFVLAQGNPGELTEARSNFLHVIIGIGIFVGASLIASIIVNTLGALGVAGISNSCS